jgi:hypothetical protein
MKTMNKPRLSIQAKHYIDLLEEFARDLRYTLDIFKGRLQRYEEIDNYQNKIDLLSSIAYFDNYIFPIIMFRQIEGTVNDEDSDVITLGINGNWGAYEFHHLFEGLDYLSKVYTIRAKLNRDAPEFRLRRGMTRLTIYRKAKLSFYLSLREELHVQKIQFGSPGLVSFEGVGEVIKELRETLDYIVTGVWIKHFLDTFYQIKDRGIRKIEDEARKADANARRAEADARRVEADLRAIEARSKIKTVIRQIRQEGQNLNQRDLSGLERIDTLADLGIRLEADGLANINSYEDQLINSISVLHRLSYEKQKLKIDTSERS